MNAFDKKTIRLIEKLRAEKKQFEDQYNALTEQERQNSMLHWTIYDISREIHSLEVSLSLGRMGI